MHQLLRDMREENEKRYYKIVTFCSYTSLVEVYHVHLNSSKCCSNSVRVFGIFITFLSSKDFSLELKIKEEKDLFVIINLSTFTKEKVFLFYQSQN